MGQPARQPRQKLLDRYELVRCIGKGGMAEVWHGRLCRVGGFRRDVAIKVLLPQYACEQDFIDMLLDEARLAGAIGHPNIVQILDVGQDGDEFYLVMEHVQGSDLRSLARRIRGAKLPLKMSLYVIAEILKALDVVHSAVDEEGRPRRIVHRDISPANVLLDERGYVKLSDFGIAHAAIRLTRTKIGSVKGKSRYMAPEQFHGKPVDHRADLYSLGVTLFEALLGDEARESVKASPFGPVFCWPKHVSSTLVPSDVEEILRTALAERPSDRYADAASFRKDVLKALRRRDASYGAESLEADIRRLLDGVPLSRVPRRPQVAVTDRSALRLVSDKTEKLGAGDVSSTARTDVDLKDPATECLSVADLVFDERLTGRQPLPGVRLPPKLKLLTLSLVAALTLLGIGTGALVYKRSHEQAVPREIVVMPLEESAVDEAPAQPTSEAARHGRSYRTLRPRR